MRALLVLAALAWGCRSSAGPHDAGAPRLDAVVRDVPSPDVTDVVDVPAPPRRVTVTVAGDLLLTEAVLRQVQSKRENGRLVALLGPVAPLLAFQTIAFANLRTPLGTAATLAASRGGAPVELARDLARVGFDVLQLSNDHTGDLGAAGLRDSLDALRAAHVLPAGVNDGDDGPHAPVIVERDGVRVAFFGATSRLLRDPGEPRGEHEPRIARVNADPTPLLGAVTAARSAVDVVVVGIHWSRERYAPVAAAQRELATRLVAAGADLVVGFGQPTLGAVQRVPSPRGEAVVAWSPGTLLSHFGSAWHRGVTPAQIQQSPWVYDPGYRDGVMLHVSFDLRDAPNLRVSRLSANAVWTSHLEGQLRVVPMRTVDERVSNERLSAIRTALGAAVRVRP
ncbi:MAG: CapA family protein [Polyangiales bacterium]